MSLLESALARIWPTYPIAHGGGGGPAATSDMAGLLLTGQAAGAAPTLTSAAAMVLTWQEAASKLAQSALGAKEKEHVWPYMVLAAAYGLVGFIALVQLVRIQRRVPEYGWTTQKVFHLLNFVVNAIRCFVFFLEEDVLKESAQMPVVKTALLDLPGLLFFTTYTLLVLFWAEIYHQARGLPMESLRPYFMATNAAIYAIQIAIWGCMWHYKDDGSMMDILNIVGKSFFACVSLTAAVGFILYGGRLFLMLRRFPIESRGRRKKLHEVGMVTLICFTCFTIRACIMAYSAFFNPNYDVDTLEHPGYDAIYYSLVELIPSALVLYILRKLPPKRNSQTLR